jgi:hypothetical protein
VAPPTLYDEGQAQERRVAAVDELQAAIRDG